MLRENWSQSRRVCGYQEVVLSAAIISPRALQTWHLSQKRSTNPTLIYSHLTAGEVINLSLDRFRRVNYNLEKQEPGMNNSYTYKTAHQLPGTFTAQLYSVLLAVKGGKKGMHDRGDGCKIKVGFHKTEIHHRRPFRCFYAPRAALAAALSSISCFQRLVLHSLSAQ